ncbi:MAG: efflux RND transporter periplasmic adaptor subunit [Pirellulales bacterium]|nr:efflux RND transporter periplasmic adaptor subunit [Pirellulales bacterium]
MASTAGRATVLSIVTLATVASAALLYFYTAYSPKASAAAMTPGQCEAKDLQQLTEQSYSPETGATLLISISREKAKTIGLKTAPVRRDNWPDRLRVTGRLELNEGRLAHVSPLVDGVVREVPVQLGQVVEKGDILAYIDSREVGETKLQYAKDQLNLISAKKSNDWHKEIHENTFALLKAIEEGKTFDNIEATFRDRPVGTYRKQLVSAMARLKRAKADFERIHGLGKDSIIPEKKVVSARAEYEAAEATYRALMEQIKFDVQQEALDAQQELRAAEAAVAISRSHLLILGYSEKDINTMDPFAEAERVAYYPIRAPITGTIMAKNAPLSKHIDQEIELFRIADLSTVWLCADVFEKDLNATLGLQGKSVTFEAGSYPGRQFAAGIFSLGNIVDDKTRATRLLATVNNSERLLKPGMFVEIELTPSNDVNVLQLPSSAIQRHGGVSFVFIFDGKEGFERRDVKLGRSTSELVEIRDGLSDGESVVINGGFALKSEMLSELMAE